MNHLCTVRTALAAAVLACTAAAASAADYNFTGSITFADASSLVGQAFSGTFSLDLPAADFTGDVALTQFNFSFGGQTYTLGSADAASMPYVSFDAGQFSAMLYTSAANGTSLTLYTGFPDAMQGTLDHTSATGQYSTGSFQVSAVPEPDTYALLLGGMGLVGWLARRRAAA